MGTTYTSSSLFLKTLADAGITHAFVNWGSDHPALLEDLARQQGSLNARRPRIVTCPNEMVALSAAQGYAQITGRPAAVIVHVDVGTQALAGAVHNVDRARVPVLIYAGASPFSAEGELKGSRNEWIMWLQDIPDQSAIVRQYMRHTVQIHSAKNIPQVVHRALQIATSEPQGPVYMWARREVMEEEIPKALMTNAVAATKWPAIEPCALSPNAATRIAIALLTAQSPLIITSHIGRNPLASEALIALSLLLALPISCVTPSYQSLPLAHPFQTGFSYLAPGGHTPYLSTADVIIVIDCITPWIPVNDKPKPSARVFVLDSGDPLRRDIGTWSVEAEMVCRADAQVALEQILDAVRVEDAEVRRVGEAVIGGRAVKARAKYLTAEHAEWMRALDEAESAFASPEPVPTESDLEPVAFVTVPNVLGALRRAISELTASRGADVLILNEGITAYPLVWAHMGRLTGAKHMTSGGSSLGWALGAAVGASLGARVDADEGEAGKPGYELVVVIVGDGSFMFGVPSTAYWMARKYDTPFLTIVLNNGGWKSPKSSVTSIYPSMHASQTAGPALTVGFGPHAPDYGGIAVAASAGWASAVRVDAQARMEDRVREAVRTVHQEKVLVSERL
ncbi:hypothetical protein PLICRDRAFT_538119 [Plicaturopsis crispa FD-325 SS-3]|nr:hypothetical protein PLICRDRAFT_538119 [Plicaturopsis crispa FD-325 SS-3]